MNAAALLTQWIAHLRDERRFAPNSVEAYERDVAALLGFLSGHLGGAVAANDLATLEPRDLRAYLAHRRQGPDALADRSISRALAAIRSFFRYLERRHGIANARLALVRGPKLKRALPRPVSEIAALALIQDAEDAAAVPWIGARDAALITLLYAAGLRISEALALTGRDRPLPEALRSHGQGRQAAACAHPYQPRAKRWNITRTSARMRSKAMSLCSADRAAGRCQRASRKPRWRIFAVVWGCLHRPRRTHCGTHSPRICSRMAVICARSKICSGTNHCRRLRAT